MKKLLSFDFSNFRGDFFGGLTAGIVALPLALAFGEQTELGAIAGLYGAIALAIFAALLGGTPTQISGPTAPMTVVSAVIIGKAVADADGSVETALPLIIATFLLAGFFEAMLGVIRLGKYIKYIPYPVVSGFMSGIGVIIVVSQIFPFFGGYTPKGGAIGTLTSIPKIPGMITNYYSILVALVTIGIIYLLPRITKAVPSALVALVAVSLGAALIFGADDILRINSKGPIPTGLPKLQLGFLAVFQDWSKLMLVMEYAITLALLGAIDSLLTSVVADNMTKTKHHSDQELIGQGIGNMASALIGGLPGAGATMRTVININSGGKTKISGIVAGLFLLAVLLGLGSLVGHVPNAVLAGILITVGIGIIDYKGLKHLGSVPLTDAIVMITVLVLTVFVDLLIAVAIGMILSSILFMKKISDVMEHRTQSAPSSYCRSPSI
ncbi:MAG: SulP family inorganic anion transporter, partial [Bacteroidota bacterium]